MMRFLYETLDVLFKNFKFYNENFDKVYNWVREAEIVASGTETQKLVRAWIREFSHIFMLKFGSFMKKLLTIMTFLVGVLLGRKEVHGAQRSPY